MSIREIEPKLKMGPIRLGSRLGPEITDFPHQVYGVRKRHPIEDSYDPFDYAFATHTLHVVVTGPDQVTTKCITNKNCVAPQVMRGDQINHSYPISRFMRWVPNI